MKKVLILAYDFPPYVSVGALRPYSWYKYFYRSGLYPVIVTRQWSNKYGNNLDYISPGENKKTIVEETNEGTILRTPYTPNTANKILLKYGKNKYKVLRKIISAFYEIIQWIINIGPKSELYYEAKKYIKENNIDFIIATGEPFILFRYASKLSRKYKIPWIADYRDPWSQSPVRSPNTFLKIWNIYNEKRFLRNVDFIITVSEMLKQKLYYLIKSKNIYIIENGFDEELIHISEKTEQNSDILSIGFAGTIYKWHPLKNVLNIFKNLKDKENINIKLNFYGINDTEEISDLIKTSDNNYGSLIKLHPKMPNDKLIRELASNNLLLLFNDYSVMGTKIYDYLCAKRSIILCFTNDDQSQLLKEKYFLFEESSGISNNLQEDLIRKTNSGFIIENSEHLYSTLINLYSDFNSNHRIECNTYNIEQFSRKTLTRKLAAQIIENINMNNKE